MNNKQCTDSVPAQGRNTELRNPVILCADDEEANIELLEEILSPNGYEVVAVTNGKDAILRIKSQTIDLVLLDINMPEMNGFEVCRQIREDQNLRDIPIIMVTGLASHEDRVRGIEAGVEDYFSKPFHQEELLARIKILLKMKKLNDERKHAVFQREAALSALQKSHDELNYQVQVRTAELAKANDMLQADIEERKRAEEELRKSEEKYRNILDKIEDGYFEVDLAGNFTFFNPSLCRILGYPREEMPGMNNRVFMDAENAKKVYRAFNDVYVTGIPTNGFEWETIRKDGARTSIEVSVSLIARPGEKPTGFRGLARDVTEHKKAEDALRESEKKLREAQEMAHLGFWYWNVKTGDVEWSEEVFKIFCLDPKEFNPHIDSILALSPWPEDHQRAQELIHRAIESHDQGSYEQKFLRPDQSVGYYYSTFQGNYDEKGNLFSIVGTVLDITERKRAEEALESERTLLRNLIDNVPDRIYAKDCESRFIMCNEAMIRRLGKTSIAEIVGKSDFDLLPPEMAQRFHADEQAIIESGIPLINREEPLTTEDGSITRWNLATKVPLLDKQGNRIGIVGVGREITDLKQAEQKLKDTLESLRKAIGTTIQVMVSAVETRDPYTAGHQIRSADLARAIADEMGLPQDIIEGIRMAGSIHDIGKLSIPAEILSKPIKLSDIEFRLIKEHARLGYEILKDVESPWPLAEIVHQHHERFDGSGYPRNLKGEEILIEARILAVADTVEAMASHRPYRPGLGIDLALNEIEKNRGLLYDGHAVDACLRLFREKGFKLEAT